ncbi:RNA-binding S4 domain-containing protein [Motilibacter aurantiacus]|uniref:RNA-binding S4 domain-containing protein n=1 Tax=Motilibacter aurantiacus TaxID=2714955 RepID=UPI00140DA7B8|nr:RNA-binding S4 domain-containing protein [Motilibacter aurantiacus]
MDEVEVGNGIRLGQLLKLVGVVDTGGAAKELLESGQVLLNGQPETRRGAQLAVGDVVQAGGRTVRLT